MTKTNFEYRPAQRDAWCRCCDRKIKRGEYMISGYSLANRGMWMHFHIDCVAEMLLLVDQAHNVCEVLNAHTYIDFGKLSRLTIVDRTEEDILKHQALEKWGVNIEPSIQDEGRTLKLFLSKRGKE